MEETTMFDRIKGLCEERRVSVAKLESDIGLGNGTITKWGKNVSPSADKLLKIATYFNVSVDYLLCRTDIRSSASDVIGDDIIASIQRAKERMIPGDEDRMMMSLKISFGYAFGDSDSGVSK